jgi:hypothetical protein
MVSQTSTHKKIEKYVDQFSKIKLFYHTLGLAFVAYLIVRILLFLKWVKHQCWLNYGVVNYFKKVIFNLSLKLPMVRAKLDKMVEKEGKKFIEGVKANRSNEVYEMPQEGWSYEVILDKMKVAGKESYDFVKKGQLSGGVYISDDKHWEMITEVMKSNIFANPIHNDDFKFCC